MTGPRNATASSKAFPGFEIDEIAARRFAKVTGEINLPPVRFAEVGTAAFYLSYIRPAVFAGAMATEEPHGRQSHHTPTSARSSTSTSPSRCGCRWSFQSARRRAVPDGDYRKTELLASLKIM